MAHIKTITSTGNTMFYKWETSLNVFSALMKANPMDFYTSDFFSKQLGVSPKDIILQEDGHELTLEKVMVLYAKKSPEYNCFIKNDVVCLKKQELQKPVQEDNEAVLLSDAQKDLMSELRKYRMEQANNINSPAYKVFSNKALESLIQVLPADEVQLKKVYGFGKRKIETYGEDIIEIIKNFLSENPNLKPNEDFITETKEDRYEASYKKYESQIDMIRTYVSTQNKWVSVSELEKFFNIRSHGRLDRSDNMSTVAHLINRFLKKEGFVTKKLEYEEDYEIFVKYEKSTPVEAEESESDNEYYEKIVNYIDEGKNVFVTGNAGTGKSYLLNKLKNKYGDKLELTSTTGLAAVNIKGVTIHSWAGVGICNKEISKCVKSILVKRPLSSKIRKCEMLAIDEISMMKGDAFTYIDCVLRQVRGNSEPFGGIQLLLFGDFFQLPPVEDNNEGKDFCFETETWKELNLQPVILDTIYRQTDKDFIKALNDIRVDKVDPDDIDLLKSREIDYDTSETPMLHIFSRNDEADNYNKRRFDSIDSKTYTYDAISGVYRGRRFVEVGLTDKEHLTMEIFKKNCRASETLKLKVGCRVMLLVNLDFERGLINGACGEVVSLSDDYIIVRFDNGVSEVIEQHKFESYYNDVLQASITQYPLKLAYAITIHKSQGMTLDNVVVDCNRIFEEGQTYVALSRVRSLDGLYLKGFTPDKIKVNEKVVGFYNELEFLE